MSRLTACPDCGCDVRLNRRRIVMHMNTFRSHCPASGRLVEGKARGDRSDDGGGVLRNGGAGDGATPVSGPRPGLWYDIGCATRLVVEVDASGRIIAVDPEDPDLPRYIVSREIADGWGTPIGSADIKAKLVRMADYITLYELEAAHCALKARAAYEKALSWTRAHAMAEAIAEGADEVHP